jgi:hypothetical protein
VQDRELVAYTPSDCARLGSLPAKSFLLCVAGAGVFSLIVRGVPVRTRGMRKLGPIDQLEDSGALNGGACCVAE